MMVLHKTSDQYLATCKVSTQSINMVKRYRLIKTLTKNLKTGVLCRGGGGGGGGQNTGKLLIFW